MNNNNFFKRLFLWSLAIIFTATLQACTQSKKSIDDIDPFEDHLSETDTSTEIIRFGVCADVHQDYFYGVPSRMQKFVDEMNEENVDFIIQLGDFCFPKKENDGFMKIWNSFKGPKYHVIGNHDCEISSKQVFMDYVDYPADKPYYSFDIGGYHFVVLDLNFGMKNGQLQPYTATYGKVSSNDFESIQYIDDLQYDWLEQDLKKTNKRTIIYSHQPINRGLTNSARFDKIINDVNSKYKKVIVAFSGHNHQDWLEIKTGVYHWQINSMVYKYCGNECFNDTRYPAEVYAAYPAMKKAFPYQDALYTIIELDPVNKTIKSKENKSSFVPPTPDEMGFHGISPNISERTIKYK